MVCWANLELLESGAAALGPALAMKLLDADALAKVRLAMKLILEGVVEEEEDGKGQLRPRTKLHANALLRAEGRSLGEVGEGVYAER